nr:RING finger protein 112-like [Caretta caretta]
MEQLREDVTCSICLNVFSDPVSIECGHNFCRGCLAAHWSQVSAQGHRCPECRASCSRNRMIPDTRVRNLVEKITEHLQEEPEPQGPGAQPEPGHPVQLVRLDEEENLILDEEALSRCLEQGGARDAPVCVVSIVGVKRRGKSFLLNYLLRRLQSPDARDGSWMGREDEPLEGFEWRADMQQVTKGVWAWSQPIWVPTQGGKVAVLLVDTEGSMGIERKKENSIKLSAFSMLLSSYQILNISNEVNDADLEYLEMFVHVAEEVGKAYGLEPIQHLDLLVRDWSSSPVLGAEGGEQHLRYIQEMLKARSPCKHPKALEALKRSSSRCYLMPSPGKRITMGSEGRLRDMDEDFRESLRDYVTALVSSAGQHVRMDQHGEMLNGTQLAAKIKNLSDVMKNHRSGFSSPCQMAITFHNQRVLDRARADHAVFLKEKDGLSRRMVDCLKVDLSTMAEQLVEKRRSLLERCREELQEPEETLLTELEKELTREAKTFLETYRRCYQHHTTNQSVLDRARADHAVFLKEKDGLSRRMVDCLTVDPSAMAEQFMEQRRSLLKRCREELQEPEETLLTELEEELTREDKTFLETYRRRYLCHTTNQRALVRACADHAEFLKEKDTDSRNPLKCLKVTPEKMAKQFAERRGDLLWQCQTDMLPKKEALGTELEKELRQKKEALETEMEKELRQKKEALGGAEKELGEEGLMLEAESFLETYRKRFKKFAIAAGVGVGGLVLAPMAQKDKNQAEGTAAAIAAEAAVLGIAGAVGIGAGAGAVAGGCVGGGVGWGVGKKMAQKDKNQAEGTASEGEEEDGTEELSDTARLI